APWVVIFLAAIGNVNPLGFSNTFMKKLRSVFICLVVVLAAGWLAPNARTAPTVVGVSGTTNQVTVIFSEQVSLNSATDLSHYVIDNGVTVSSATLSAGSNSVQLATSPMT